MQEEFYKLGILKLKTAKYDVYRSKEFGYYYFMKFSINGEKKYPTSNELRVLTNLFTSTRAAINSKFISNLTKESGPVSLIPKVIYKGKVVLLTVSLLISIVSGCSSINIIDSSENDIKDNEIIVMEEPTEPTGPTIIDTSKISDVRAYLEKQNPTWDDLLELIVNKTNILDKYKDMLIRAIGNLKDNTPDLELDILYYNINRLSIVEQTADEFDKTTTLPALGMFDGKTGVVYLDIDGCTEEKLEASFIHEIIGHGSSLAEIDLIKTDNMYIDHSIHIRSTKGLDYLPGYVFINDKFGYSFEEAKAEMLTMKALSKDLLYTNTYRLEVQELAILLAITDTTLDELINEGLTVIGNRLFDIGINTYELFNNADDFQTAQRLGELFDVDTTIKTSNNICAVYDKYYEYLLKNGHTSEDAIAEVKRIIKDTDMGPASTGFISADLYNASYTTDSMIDIILSESDTIVDLSIDNLKSRKSLKNTM